MANREYNALTRSDRQVLEAFERIDAELSLGGQSRVVLQLANDYARQLQVLLSEIRTNPEVLALQSSDGAVVSRLMQSIPNLAVNISVGRQGSHDQISVYFPNDAEFGRVIPILSAVAKHLPGFDAAKSIERVLGVELKEFYGRREESLVRLEDLSQRLIEQNEAYRRKLDKNLDDARQKEIQERERAVSELRRQFDEKQEALKVAQAELEAQKRELDDRASRHVRREIRKEFLQKLATREKKFSLSESTIEKRQPIHWLFIGMIGFAAFMTYSGLLSLIGAHVGIAEYVRTGLSVIALFAAVIFYIKWNDQWFRQHADEEFRLQRLALDFDRASWVVELVMEWKQEKGEELPKELVDRLTTTLFSSEPASVAVRHPAEDLASALLGASTNVKVNVPGGEITLDRKGLKALGA